MTTDSNTNVSPLTPEQIQAISSAKKRLEKIKSAAGVANFNAWTTLIIAAFSLMGVMYSMWALVSAGILFTIAFVESHGRNQMLKLNESGVRKLACNQFVFMLIIIAYSIWRLMGPNPYDEELKNYPEVAELVDVQGLYNLTYYLLIGGTLLFQGGCALYYYKRIEMVRDYVAETPQWVIDSQGLLD